MVIELVFSSSEKKLWYKLEIGVMWWVCKWDVVNGHGDVNISSSPRDRKKRDMKSETL